MKLEKFLNKVKLIDDKYRLKPFSLLLLNHVIEHNKKGEVTIMQVLEDFPYTSPMTTHKLLKELIAKKILAVGSNLDGRKKELVKGTKWDDLAKLVSEA
jgi:hypothetical protein